MPNSLFRTKVALFTALFCISGMLVGNSAARAEQRPDLARLYAGSIHKANNHQPPLILVHGLMGGRLWNVNKQAEDWPGKITDVLFSNYKNLALPIDPNTLEPVDDGRIAQGITDRAAGRDYYGALIHTLENAGRYYYTIPGEKIQDFSQRRFYIFSYDWRQDNVVSAKKLSQLIEQIRKDYNNPKLKVDIVAHSMGGLIVHYYLRYGEQDVLDRNDFPVNQHGATRVRRVILLGTPNLGSVSAVQAFIHGRDVGFNTIPPEALMTMPSIYQLFPHAIQDWLITDSLDTLDSDLFDVEIWRRFQWGIFDPTVRTRIRSHFSDPKKADAYTATLENYFAKQLERARRFVWSLTVKINHPAWKLTLFGGDCELTPARLLIEEDHGNSMIRLWPKQVKNKLNEKDYNQLMLEPGDGEVTKASLLAREMLDPSIARNKYISFPVDHAFFLCERHDQLTGNINFQDNLLHTLLSLDEQ